MEGLGRRVFNAGAAATYREKLLYSSYGIELSFAPLNAAVEGLGRRVFNAAPTTYKEKLLYSSYGIELSFAPLNFITLPLSM